MDGSVVASSTLQQAVATGQKAQVEEPALRAGNACFSHGDYPASDKHPPPSAQAVGASVESAGVKIPSVEAVVQSVAPAGGDTHINQAGDLVSLLIAAFDLFFMR